MSFALQVGSVLALLVVAVPAYGLCSRLAVRTSAPTVWLRRVVITLPLLAGVAYLTFTVVDFDGAARDAVATLSAGFAPPAMQSLLGDLAAQVALFLPTAVVTLGAYAAVVPAIRRAREIDLSTWTAVRRMGRYLVVLTAFLAVLFVPFGRLVAGEDLGIAPVVLVALLLAVPLVTPALVRSLRPVRAPEAAERERLESLRSDAGLDVAESWILTDAEETLEIYLRGLPGRRHLFLSSFALTAFDDETLAALLAANAGSLRHHYRGITLTPLFGFLVAGVVVLTMESTVGYAVLIALALVLPLPVLWAARRAARRGDDDAADRVGAETLADAFERMATVQNLDVRSGGPTTVFRRRPPLGERISRLRADEE